MAYTKSTGTFLSGDQKTNCAYYVYTPEVNPKAIVQICHGMCEYMERYEHVAEFLTGQGYVVCGEDHLGHGNTAATPEDYGYFGSEGYEGLIRNVENLRQIMRKRYRSLPYILLGHSMGSFIVRQYAVDYKDSIDALVICGTSSGAQPLNAGILLTGLLSKIRGERYRSSFVRNISFKGYNDRFKSENDPYSWLTRSKECRVSYASDSKSGFTFTLNGYNAMFRLLKSVSSEEWANEVPKGLPIYIISGDEDPVGDYGEGVKTVYDRLIAAEICNLKIKLYEGARHELFNEINREEVFADLLEWLNETVDGVREARIQNNFMYGGGL